MNRLSTEKSPYLLQHAGNPVDWRPWGEEAFAAARREGKPVFLSVGYATCHWCHVMAHESFEDPDVAAVLNEHFISIKVDREERPDVDRVYMSFVQATTGSGGWPMSVWMTPDGRPFYGGTYFPPAERWGKPGFRDLLPRDGAAVARGARARGACGRETLRSGWPLPAWLRRERTCRARARWTARRGISCPATTGGMAGSAARPSSPARRNCCSC